MSGHSHSMSSNFFLSYQAIEDPEIPSGPATTPAAHQGNNRIPGVTQAHGQSTSNVSNHIEITHLNGARHHHLQALEIHNLH